MLTTHRILTTTFAILTIAACAGSDDEDDSPTGGDDDDTSGGITALTFGQTRGGLSGAEDSRRLFSVVVPSGQSKFTVMMSGGSGDPDLYVRYGSAPTLSTYDCESANVGPEDMCELVNPTAGTWYILIAGFEAYSGLAIFPFGQVGSGGGNGAAVYLGSFNPQTYRVSGTSSATGATCFFDVTWSNASIELSYASTAPGSSATLRLRGRRVSAPTTSQATGPSGTSNCLSRDDQIDLSSNFTSALPNVDASISGTNETVRLLGTLSGAVINGTITFSQFGEGRAGGGNGVITLNRQ